MSPALQADSLPTEPQVLFVTCWASHVALFFLKFVYDVIYFTEIYFQMSILKYIISNLLLILEHKMAIYILKS